MQSGKFLKKNKGKIITAGAGAVILLFIVWSSFKKTQADYYILKPIDVNYTILVNCTVEYPDPLDMAFLQDGIVKTVDIADGSPVRKGQRLIQMDDFEAKQNLIIISNNLAASELKLKNAKEETLPQLKEKLNQSKINLEQSKLMLKRYKDLESSGGISKVELENAENDYQKALSEYNQGKLELDSFSTSGLIANLQNQILIDKAQYELAKKHLEDTKLLSPYEGTVLKVNAQPGQKVSSAFTAVTVIEKKNWVLVMNVDQKELPFLKPGLPALAAMDAYPDKKIKSAIVYVCTAVDKEKNTCEVRLEISENAPFIKHGMTGSAEIYAEKYEKILALPARFIKKQPDGTYIWLWDGNKAKLFKTDVRQIGERWMIPNGIPEGSRILDADFKANPSKLTLGKEVLIK